MFRLYTVLFFILTIFVIGCEKDTTISQGNAISDDEPDQKFLTSRIIITENGITTAIVQAESVQVYMDTDLTSARGGVHIDFFNKKGEHISTLTADSGEVFGLYEKVDSLKAHGNVVIVSADKTKRMETGHSLIWISSSHVIYGERGKIVKLVTEGGVEQGINFVANDDLTEYSMGKVSGVLAGSDITFPGK